MSMQNHRETLVRSQACPYPGLTSAVGGVKPSIAARSSVLVRLCIPAHYIRAPPLAHLCLMHEDSVPVPCAHSAPLPQHSNNAWGGRHTSGACARPQGVQLPYIVAWDERRATVAGQPSAPALSGPTHTGTASTGAPTPNVCPVVVNSPIEAQAHLFRSWGHRFGQCQRGDTRRGSKRFAHAKRRGAQPHRRRPAASFPRKAMLDAAVARVRKR